MSYSNSTVGRLISQFEKPPALPKLRRDSSRNLLSHLGPKPDRYPSFFTIPHKAFRVMFFEVFEKIGSVNHTDEEDMLSLQKMLNQACFIYGHHNHAESSYFAEQLKEKHGDLVKQWNSDHEAHDRKLGGFQSRFTEIIALTDHKESEKALATLYIEFGEYVAEDLAHMAFEERKVMKAFWDSFSDEELASIEQGFLKTVDPEFMQASLPFILRAHNINGRIGILKMLQSLGTPEEHVQGILAVLALQVRPKELSQIKEAIQVA